MTPPPQAGYTEDELVEQPAVGLFSLLGWETLNAYHEFDMASGSPLGRETKSEVVLVSRLHPALEGLNPAAPPEAINQAIEELTRDRSRLSLAAANREIYGLLKNGVSTRVPDAEEGEKVELVRVIDWDEPRNNDFLMCSQFWVAGEVYTRRADLVGFVNGLPLVLFELKASHKHLDDGYQKNIRDYREQSIPHLFWYNAFIVVSNGSATRVGSTTAPWEHFSEWKKSNSEGEQGVVSLETGIRATCDPARLLDLVENFTLFSEEKGGLIKILGKNHQYLGVNNALDAIRRIRENKGRLGVFWHTQGSGKSYSMIFLAQKVLRKMPGNWTFVVVTDRKELDQQIYQNFTHAGAVTEEGARAESGEDLKRLLREDHRYVFTLIHKFFSEPSQRYPVLSRRDNIIVMTDEAHRTQYDVLALNMRNALPNAAFLAFTGTPLIVTEERTKQVFGDYVSIYNFRDSVQDNATVPLYYENRIPELQLTNEDLNEDMERVLESAELDERQEEAVEREFSREYHVITREDRLDAIGQDVVDHFLGRGFAGKAMVVSIDKATAVRMYDEVQKHWRRRLEGLNVRLASAIGAEERESLHGQIKSMQETDMAVVVSQSQNEVEDLRAKGVEILPHRIRMNNEDLAARFKDPEDTLRIAFVCAMWMTGFDAPACSTIYLDKPMRNHTLMQTIARANRVFRDKVNGLIVDYAGIFRNLQKALAIYGSGSGGGVQPGDSPILDKAALIEELCDTLQQVSTFLLERQVNTAAIVAAEGFERIRALDDAVDALVVNDEVKTRYLAMAAWVDRLFRAILPDPSANEFAVTRKAFVVIADKIRALLPPVDISGVMQQVEDLLDDSVAPVGYRIGRERPDQPYEPLDLSKIDIDALREKLEKGRRHTEAERLKGTIGSKLCTMVRMNRTRVDYLSRLQQLVDDYNAGRVGVDLFYEQLLQLAKDLREEERRGIAESLSEEELAVFDLLTRPSIDLSDEQRARVRAVARDLIDTLKAERLVLDWRKRQQSRAGVRKAIEERLDLLPEAYSKLIYQQKCEVVYQHVYDSYYGAGSSVYGIPA